MQHSVTFISYFSASAPESLQRNSTQMDIESSPPLFLPPRENDEKHSGTYLLMHILNIIIKIKASNYGIFKSSFHLIHVKLKVIEYNFQSIWFASHLFF